jgi:hypothetical protein
LAITSPTSGGRSVGIVRSQTQTMEFGFSFLPLDALVDDQFRLNVVALHNLIRFTAFLLKDCPDSGDICQRRVTSLIETIIIDVSEIMYEQNNIFYLLLSRYLQ